MSDFIQDAIDAAELTLQTAPKAENVYTCTITSRHAVMIRTLTMKPGYDAPTLGAVLLYYSERAQQVEEIDDVLEWASGHDRDLNDPKTVPTFKQLVTDQDDLRRLLSDRPYQTLISGLEISQAISNARPR